MHPDLCNQTYMLFCVHEPTSFATTSVSLVTPSRACNWLLLHTYTSQPRNSTHIALFSTGGLKAWPHMSKHALEWPLIAYEAFIVDPRDLHQSSLSGRCRRSSSSSFISSPKGLWALLGAFRIWHHLCP